MSATKKDVSATKKLRHRVLLADDHRLILDGVKHALEESGEFEVVGEAMTGSQVIAARATARTPTS